MAMKFAKPQLMLWAGNKITDHNRSPLSVDVERIENKKRMANGTMRKYFIIDKHTFSMSWDMLPNTTAATVDGFWGADAIEDFYNSTPGAFQLILAYANAPSDTYTVMFTDFSKTLLKRGRFDFYDVSVGLEEV